jgi:hypothetical protein
MASCHDTHVIGRNPVHALGGPGHATENVAAANDQCHLCTRGDALQNLIRHATDRGQIDAKSLAAHENFPGDLQ